MVHGKFQHNPICNFREKVKQRNVAYYRLVVFTRSNWVLYAYKITLWCLIKGKYFSQKRPPPGGESKSNLEKKGRNSVGEK